MDSGSREVVLDLSQLRSVTLDDEELMREVAGALVRDASNQIEDLQSALENTDAAACQRVAHSLTGACGNVGARSMAALSFAVQRQAAKGDLRLCGSQVEGLRVELERLREAVESI